MTALRDTYVDALETENDTLRARIAELETMLGIRVEVALAFELTGQETRLFGLLLKRDLVTKDMAMSMLYGNRADDDAVAQEKIVDVFVCKLRAKLKVWNISIKTQWGQGYYLTAETKVHARTLLAIEQAA